MKDLLTRALDAHGGLSRWREIEAFQLKVSIGAGYWTSFFKTRLRTSAISAYVNWVNGIFSTCEKSVSR